MKVHNLMEDIVLEMIDEVFRDENAKKKKDFCTCPQCRLDVACYVLNRITPLYMISGRGLAHLQVDYQEKLQREADLASLIHRGIEHVSAARRPHFPHADQEEEAEPKGPFFNFPQITGRLFNSENFEPISGIDVSLLDNGEPVRMVDLNWQNPYLIVSNTAGVFSFWPYPRSAETVGEKKSFDLEIIVDDAAYKPFRHYFKLLLQARETFLDLSWDERVYSLPDLYLIAGK